MVESNWRDTLYIWDGIVTLGAATTTSGSGGGNDDDDDKQAIVVNPIIPLEWEGLWVPVTNVPDATKAEAPKRNAFKKDIDAECTFVVAGTATATSLAAPAAAAEGKDVVDDDYEKEGYDDHFFVAKLTEGAGWDMKDDDNASSSSSKMKKYQDETHDVLIKTLKWSGNQKDQREYLIVAKGKNEFGPFISVGWMKPGCRWTLARRYLSEDNNNDNNNEGNDPRVSWSLMDLHEAVVRESIVIEEGSDERILKIPPWQADVMHVKYQGEGQPSTSTCTKEGGGKRQKTSPAE